MKLNLGQHCSDICLSLFQCCFVMVFRWNCPSSRPKLRGKGKGGRAQHVKLFLQLTQVLMSQIVAARKISTLNELKKKTIMFMWHANTYPAIYTVLKSYLNFGYKHCFYSKKGIYITCSAKRMCLFKYKRVFLPYSSNTRMEGVWCNNALTPGVDIPLFGKHCSRMLFCQPPINNESKRRLM